MIEFEKLIKNKPIEIETVKANAPVKRQNITRNALCLMLGLKTDCTEKELLEAAGEFGRVENG